MIKNIYEMLQDVCVQNKDRIFFVRQKKITNFAANYMKA